MSASSRVSVRGLAHRFPGTGWLFEDLTFTIVPGQVVAVTGPSGCGKSTLLSILAGWEKPARGEVRRTDLGRVAWVFQNPHGVPHRTALDHVAFPYLTQGYRRGEAVKRATANLATFGLSEVADREFAALSGGEAQRLMLARAVATGPDLLLVDEPTAQLDRAMAATVSATLSGLAQDDMIVVVATHDPDVRAHATHELSLAKPVPSGESEAAVEHSMFTSGASGRAETPASEHRTEGAS